MPCRSSMVGATCLGMRGKFGTFPTAHATTSNPTALICLEIKLCVCGCFICDVPLREGQSRTFGRTVYRFDKKKKSSYRMRREKKKERKKKKELRNGRRGE